MRFNAVHFAAASRVMVPPPIVIRRQRTGREHAGMHSPAIELVRHASGQRTGASDEAVEPRRHNDNLFLEH